MPSRENYSPAPLPSFHDFMGGLVEREDARELEVDELTSAVGVEYRPGTGKVHTTGARKNAGTFGSATHVPGLWYAQYDSSGQSRLITGSGANLYEAAPATSGMTGTLVTMNGATLTYASTPAAIVTRMFNEQLIIASGVGVNVTRTVAADGVSDTLVRGQNVLRRNDGTYVLMGLVAPQETVAVVASTVASPSTSRPSPVSGTGAWKTPELASDTDDTTVAYASTSSVGTVVHTWKFGAVTASGSKLKILHSGGAGTTRTSVGGGGMQQTPATARLKIELSINAGSTFVTVSNKRIPYHEGWTDVNIPNASYLANDIQVRATINYTAGTTPAIGFINTIKITNAPATAPTGDQGFHYLVTECEIGAGGALIGESDPSKESATVTLATGNNIVTLTLPSVRENKRSTHWRIYRQPNGGALGEFDRYGLIAEVPMTDSSGNFIVSQSYIDTFEKPLDEIARPVVDVLTVGSGDDVTFYFKNTPPPLYSSIEIYKGSLVGVPVTDTDNVYYSPPFELEHRPSLYALPMRSPRNDAVVAVRAIDDVLLFFFSNWTKRMEGLPLIIQGVFDPSNASEASLTRGLAGVLAMDALTMPREEGGHFIFCVDREGMYITNGFQFIPWSNNLKWGDHVNFAALAQCQISNNAVKRRLRVYYPEGSATVITRAFDFYYGEGFMRPDGMPRQTGPHYSNARGEAEAVISGAAQRFTSSNQSGKVFWEDATSYFTDDSLAYNGSGHVPRTVTTGDLPITQLGGQGYIQRVALRTVRGSYASITQTVSLKQSYGETLTATQVENPATPSPMGVYAAGETFTFSFDDTGAGTEKTEVLGLYVDVRPLDRAGGALRASLNANAGSTALPTV